MIDKKTYKLMKEKYGKVSSWAVWEEQLGGKVRDNVGDLHIFDDPKIYDVLNTGYVFVGLNVSGIGTVETLPDWSNFHSEYHTHNDFKLRYALKDTPYWGSYLTDIIKLHSDSHGENVIKHLKENPDVLASNIKSFEEEIEYLGDKPILVAMGDKVYRILSSNLGRKYTIVPIKHYSYTISKENYRNELLKSLSEY